MTLTPILYVAYRCGVFYLRLGFSKCRMFLVQEDIRILALCFLDWSSSAFWRNYDMCVYPYADWLFSLLYYN